MWPERVEAALIQIEGVARVRVMGRPDPEWGEVVVAQVVASGEAPSLDELRAQVKDTLPAYMAPREMEIVADLPVTPSGKLLRR